MPRVDGYLPKYEGWQKNDAMSVFELYLKRGTKDDLKEAWLECCSYFNETRFKAACKFIREHKQGFDRIEEQHKRRFIK